LSRKAALRHHSVPVSSRLELNRPITYLTRLRRRPGPRSGRNATTALWAVGQSCCTIEAACGNHCADRPPSTLRHSLCPRGPFLIAEPLKVIALYWMGGGALHTWSRDNGLRLRTELCPSRAHLRRWSRKADADWIAPPSHAMGCRLPRRVYGWLRATRAWQRAQSSLALTRERFRRMLRVAK
jgi:hypothetical protein